MDHKSKCKPKVIKFLEQQQKNLCYFEKIFHVYNIISVKHERVS